MTFIHLQAMRAVGEAASKGYLGGIPLSTREFDISTFPNMLCEWRSFSCRWLKMKIERSFLGLIQ